MTNNGFKLDVTSFLAGARSAKLQLAVFLSKPMIELSDDCSDDFLILLTKITSWCWVLMRSCCIIDLSWSSSIFQNCRLPVLCFEPLWLHWLQTSSNLYARRCCTLNCLAFLHLFERFFDRCVLTLCFGKSNLNLIGFIQS